MYSNKSATPFATTNGFVGDMYWTSTERVGQGDYAWRVNMANGAQNGGYKYKNGSYYVRATRRYSSVTTVGQGDATVGSWLGTAGDGTSKLIAAPKSTEVQRAWGSAGTVRGTVSTTNGVDNTTTLFNLGSVAHPAAYYCRALTTGGYNTWYLPAKDELNTLYSNKSATPFATGNGFSVGNYYCASTEYDGANAWGQNMSNGGQDPSPGKHSGGSFVRAVRRV
jgi:hypothetical protein